MKVLTLVFCLFLSVAAFAQSQDTTKKSKAANTKAVAKPKPLLVVDGKIFNGELEAIDQNTIKSVSILKDTSAIKLYGEKGKNGAILITIKK